MKAHSILTEPDKEKRRMNRILGGLMAVAVGMGGIAFGAEKPLVAVQITSLERLASDLVALKAIPESEAKMSVSAGVGSWLGNPGLAGVDTSKPIDLYVFLPKPDSTQSNTAAGTLPGPCVAFVFPVIGNGTGFITAMAPSFPSTNKVGSIYEFSAPLGATGLKRTMFVALVPGRIVAGSKITGVREAIALVESQQGDSPLFMELPGTIRVGVDVQAAIPFLKTTSQMATDALGQQAMAKPGQPDPAKMLEAELELLLKLASDIQGYALSVRVTPESIDILSRLDPKDGTAISKLVAEDVQPSPKYMALPPADSFISWIGSGMDKWMDVFREPYIATMEKMGTAMGNPEMGTSIRQMMMNIKGTYAGDVAAAVVPDTDGKLGLVGFTAVSDPVKAKGTKDNIMSAYSSNFVATAPRLAIRTGSPRSYKSVNIQAYSYPASNMPPMAMPGFMSKMKWEMAFDGNHMIYVMGSSELMNSAIDRLNASAAVPVTSHPPFTTVFPQVQQPPSYVYTASLVKLAKQGLALLPGADPALLASIHDKTGGLAGYGMIKGDNLIGTDRIMLDEIEGLKVVLPMLGKLLTPLLMPPGSAPAP